MTRNHTGEYKKNFLKCINLHNVNYTPAYTLNCHAKIISFTEKLIQVFFDEAMDIYETYFSHRNRSAHPKF